MDFLAIRCLRRLVFVKVIVSPALSQNMKKRSLSPLGTFVLNGLKPYFEVSLIMTGKFELSLGESLNGAPSMGPQHEAHR